MGNRYDCLAPICQNFVQLGQSFQAIQVLTCRWLIKNHDVAVACDNGRYRNKFPDGQWKVVGIHIQIRLDSRKLCRVFYAHFALFHRRLHFLEPIFLFFIYR